MKMQYELLTDKFDGDDTTATVVDLIKSMAEGTGAHHAGALKFGLREGFSLPRPKSPETIQQPVFNFVVQSPQVGKRQARRGGAFGQW